MSLNVCPQIDLVLLEDLSGSFTDDLPVLKSQVPNLIATLEGYVPDIDFGVASFIDKPTGGFAQATDYTYQTHLAISSDNTSVQAAIDAMATRNGLDTPEAQLEALLMVALRTSEIGWRAGSKKVVMLSTDSDFHVAGDFASAPANNLDAILDGTPEGTGEDYPTISGVASALMAAQIFPVFSVTSAMVPTYEALVGDLGGGAVVTLTSNSDNYSDAVRTALAKACGVITHEGTENDDTITGTENDDGIYGELGDDSLEGEGGEDVVDGGSGSDTCHGGSGNDDIYGGSGDDDLHGDEGDDDIRGGLGDDTLWGGTGADTFIITPGDGIDVIADFEDGLDLLDLSAFDIDDAGAAVLGATALTGGGVKVVLPDGTDISILGISLANFDINDVILTGGNARPVAQDDTASTTGTAPVTIDVLANDADVENDPLSVTDPGSPAGGSVVLNGDGTITYTANPGFVGTDTWVYTISDGGKAATANVSVSVAPVLIGGPGADALTGTAANELMDGLGGDDTIVAGFGDDTAHGGDGNDAIDVGDGADFAYGGAGHDTISGGPASNVTGHEDDWLEGGDGDDLILGGGGGDDLLGDGGNDTLDGGSGDDNIEGGSGNDSVIGGGGKDDLKGGDGNDTLDAGAGEDQADGGDGHDVFIVGTGPLTIQDEGNQPGSSIDSIRFGAGIAFSDLTLTQSVLDLLITGPGVDIEIQGQFDQPEKAIEFLDFADGTRYDLIGGALITDVVAGLYTDATFTTLIQTYATVAGALAAASDGQAIDVLDPAAAGDVGWQVATADNLTLRGLSPFDGQIALAPGLSSLTLMGSTAADLAGNNDANALSGSGGGNSLDGRGGNDTLSGSSGADVILGGAGDDSALGEAGSDSLDGGAGHDTLAGGGGTDTLLGSDGDDRLLGGANNDSLDGGAGDDRLWGEIGRDTMDGGAGDDALYGGNAADLLSGSAGHDTLVGQGAEDSIFGGDGNDSISGGASADVIDAGAGDDTADGGAFNDVIQGGLGNDLLKGGTGLDTLMGNDGADTLLGGTRRDALHGGQGDDLLDGGIGTDLLNGDGGNDTLLGGAANDTLDGGAGVDSLDGGSGADLLMVRAGDGGDTLAGGAGADTFDFETGFGTATVADFSAQDVIDLADVAAVTGFADLTIVYGTDASIDLGGGDILTLVGVTGGLSGADFLF